MRLDDTVGMSPEIGQDRCKAVTSILVPEAIRATYTTQPTEIVMVPERLGASGALYRCHYRGHEWPQRPSLGVWLGFASRKTSNTRKIRSLPPGPNMFEACVEVARGKSCGCSCSQSKVVAAACTFQTGMRGECPERSSLRTDLQAATERCSTVRHQFVDIP